MCGSGVGTFLLAPLSSILVDSYGWRGCNRVMAALCLACSFCGLVMVPKKRRISVANDSDVSMETRASRCGLLSNLKLILIIIGNMPFVMGIYTSYTYLPAASKDHNFFLYCHIDVL